MMTMTRQQLDGFNDSELTTFAIEIINDLTNDPTIGPPVGLNDAFICELAEEIQKEIELHNNNTKTSKATTYTDPSLYLQSLNPSISTTGTNDNMVYLSYPKTSPTIISRRELAMNDSFNRSLPPIPSPKNSKQKPVTHFKFPGNKKRPVITYTKRNKHKASAQQSKSYSPPNKPQQIRFRSPYHPPPVQMLQSPYHPPPVATVPLASPQIAQLRISLGRIASSDDPLSPASSTSDTASFLSPRELTPSPKACTIPDFSDCDETDAVVIRVTRNRPNTMKRSKKKIAKPMDISTARAQKKRYNTKKAMRYHSTKNIFMTQHSEAKLKDRRVFDRKRSNSVVLSSNGTAKVQYNEYAVEVGDELVFINYKTQIGESKLN
eukprot:65904_1